jgi:hypothetical protein
MRLLAEVFPGFLKKTLNRMSRIGSFYCLERVIPESIGDLPERECFKPDVRP